jgi:hypothetical protein
MEENTFVGKVINGKEVTEAHSNGKTVNFIFQDGTYESAPIVDGKVIITFDEVTVSQETDYVDMDGAKIDVPSLNDTEEDEIELDFYKVLQPIPFIDEQGTQMGEAEVGSVQEVPTLLGDNWVELGLAEKVEKPEESLLGKAAGVIGDIFGTK